MFIDEFSSLVTASLESGIRSYWTRETYRLSGDFSSVIKNDVKEDKQLIAIGDLVFPIIVLLVGTLLALLEFIAEYVYHQVELIKSRRSQIPPLKVIRAKRINLRKWINKYSSKDPGCYKMSEFSSREDVSKFIMNKKRKIMKREKFPKGKLKGGYLVPKKLKQRTGRRIIKVVPINSDINETEV